MVIVISSFTYHRNGLLHILLLLLLIYLSISTGLRAIFYGRTPRHGGL